MEGCSFWTYFNLIWPQIHYQPMEVTSMVPPLLPVQVKGSVMENCYKEERTGKLEQPKICQHLCLEATLRA